MQASNVFGFQVPDEGWLFDTALAVHVSAALTAVIAGILATTARKQSGRHPGAGRVYLVALAFVLVSAGVMAATRWHEDAKLFAIAVVTAGLALFGWRARRQRRRGWVYSHAIGMGGSFITLFTGFYVDNGPQLPVWRLMPHWLYWTLPAAVGTPLIWFALRRYHARLTTPTRAGAPAGS